MKKENIETIKIRKIAQKDLKRAKEFQNYINSLVKERAMILLNKRKSLKEERDWIKSNLKNIKNKKGAILVAEDKKKIVGISSIELRGDSQNHVGEFGIAIIKKYRRIGLGKKLMAEVLKLAEKKLKPKLKIIRLSVYSENKVARNLYKKFGFKKVAKISRQLQYKGKLVDEVIMIKEI